MPGKLSIKIITSVSVIILLTYLCLPNRATSDPQRIAVGNFGLPGVVDLPTARRLPDGELVTIHQNHKYLFMNGISFQALPRLGVSFRYGGLGIGGSFAQGRYTWDRSFDAHVSILDEGKYIPAISLDFEISLARAGTLRSTLSARSQSAISN